MTELGTIVFMRYVLFRLPLFGMLPYKIFVSNKKIIYNLQLEQMELEVRGMNGTARDRLRGRVESHRAELKRLTQEFQIAKKPKEDVTEITVEESWDNNVTEDQRKRLLDASERIERSGRTLQNGYRMALETEEIGSQVLKELHEQRETIQRSRGRVSSLHKRLKS